MSNPRSTPFTYSRTTAPSNVAARCDHAFRGNAAARPRSAPPPMIHLAQRPPRRLIGGQPVHDPARPLLEHHRPPASQRRRPHPRLRRSSRTSGRARSHPARTPSHSRRRSSAPTPYRPATVHAAPNDPHSRPRRIRRSRPDPASNRTPRPDPGRRRVVDGDGDRRGGERLAGAVAGDRGQRVAAVGNRGRVPAGRVRGRGVLTAQIARAEAELDAGHADVIRGRRVTGPSRSRSRPSRAVSDTDGGWSQERRQAPREAPLMFPAASSAVTR